MLAPEAARSDVKETLAKGAQAQAQVGLVTWAVEETMVELVWVMMALVAGPSGSGCGPSPGPPKRCIPILHMGHAGGSSWASHP